MKISSSLVRSVTIGLLVITSSLLSFGQATLPEGFVQEQLAEGLDPTRFAIVPDGRLFVAQKEGNVVIVKDGELLSDPFLELNVDNFNERGLSGLIFHPNFEMNNWVYVYYTVPDLGFNRVSRFTANGDAVIAGSEEIIFEFDPLAGAIHNAGSLIFDEEGYLYIGAGDSGNQNNAQSLNNTLGKVLRINDDGSIPEDNPFYNILQGEERAIYAYGFRNPFSMAYQNGTGRIYVGEVGGFDWEEVNNIIAGKNYGWPIIEGPIDGETPPANYMEPSYAYPHDPGCAVIGASFYNPDNYTFPEEYHGKFFFGDYCEGIIRYMDPETEEVLGIFAEDIDRIVSINVAPNGDLYYLERRGIGDGSVGDNTNTKDGRLWRVTYSGSGEPFISVNPTSVLVAQGEDHTFEVLASGAETLNYDWFVNENIQSSNESILELTNINVSLNDAEIYCIISNDFGKDTSKVAILSVAEGSRPSAEIVLPTSSETYIAGDTIFFEGTASDPDDGPLFSESMTWTILFIHDEHSHPALGPLQGFQDGFYAVPRIGEVSSDVKYQIILEVMDSDGLTSKTSVEIQPEKLDFTVKTNPPGLPINVDGQKLNGPSVVTSVEGVQRTIEAREYIDLDGKIYLFNGWANGETSRIVSFIADEEGIEYTANYTTHTKGTGTGLLGQYYIGPRTQNDFDTVPDMLRIDSVIEFQWAFSSPDTNIFEIDFFKARWDGSIQTLASGMYTFHLQSDDGSRLTVDSQLVVDQYFSQPATERSGEIFLEEGKVYDIQIDYFEAAGGATIRLKWEHERFAKRLVPSYQLYPDLLPSFQEDVEFLDPFPNPTDGSISIKTFSRAPTTAFYKLYDINGRMVEQGEKMVRDYIGVLGFNFRALSSGQYFLQLKSGNSERLFTLIKI